MATVLWGSRLSALAVHGLVHVHPPRTQRWVLLSGYESSGKIRSLASRVIRLHQATRCHQVTSGYEPYTYTRPASCSSRGSSNSEPRGDDGVWSLRLFAFGGGARRRRWVVCMASSTYTHPASCVRCCHQAASHQVTCDVIRLRVIILHQVKSLASHQVTSGHAVSSGYIRL